MQIMDYLDNMEEEYHKSYPDDPCPMEGGYKASFERFVIESIGAEWGMLNFPTLISLISRIFYSFGVFTERQNENPRCLQRRKIREIRAIRVPKKIRNSRAEKYLLLWGIVTTVACNEEICVNLWDLWALQKNIQEIAWRFRKKVVYLQA